MKLEDHPFFEKFRQKVVEGEIEDALNDLRNFIEANGLTSSDLRITADLLEFRTNALKREVRSGIVTTEQARVERNQIAWAAIDTVMDLKKKVRLRGPAIQPEPETAFPAEMPDFIYEKVLGVASNLKNISWLEVGLQKARSVGRIVTADSYGTGFLGPDGWLYTNHHVLPTAQSCADSEVQFNYNLDWQGNPQRHFAYPLDASTFFTRADLDLSRVKVLDQGEKPLAEWGFLEFSAIPPKEGEHVTIIQHPDGGRKQVALNENKVLGFYSNFIHYATDTMPGSSGSPVFDDNWKVIGIHHAGGNLKINDAGDKRYANEAVLARPVFEALGIPL